MSKKALIAMSGGVDSSVAAFLMKQCGCDCIGVTMKLYDNEDVGISREKTCCSLDDIEDARMVAFGLGMPYYVFNFKASFEKTVIRKFISVYENGGTPNPCIDCNRYLKFNALLSRAKELGCEYVATGHYARVDYDEESGRYLLKKGIDETKDQSYVLYFLTQEQLKHIKLPLGTYRKTEIRKIAEQNGFINAAKKDSQDICFVPNGDYADFIERHTGKVYPPGDFLSTGGECLGAHSGIIRYTIGQRKGLGISAPFPLYVCKKDVKHNTVILGSAEELLSHSAVARDINLISADNLYEPKHLSVKTRYNMRDVPCTAVQTDEDTIKITFDEPQRAVTKGQALVLYDGDVVVGGGTIC